MDLAVYIPTRGRVGKMTQITLRDLLERSSIKPTLVCPVSEKNWHGHYYDNVIGLPDEINGIGPTRQWILDHSQEISGGKQGVVMIDDDMYFSKRTNPLVPGVLERADKLDPMFEWISEQLDAGFIHGGISARQGNQNIDYPFTDNIRVNNFHYFDAQAYREIGLRFDALHVMEDFYISLSLITRGYPNRVGYQYCWNQRGSGSKGGCSIYRTAQVQAEAAEGLHAAFPDFVKVVEKESQSQHGVMQKRKDVNIAWLKAWEQKGLPANFDLLVRGIKVAKEFQTKRR